MVLSLEIGVVAFLFATWALEKVIEVLKGSSLVGNILAGILCGPALLNIVYKPEAWALIGKIGLYLLVVDGTLSINLEKVRLLGFRAFLAAFTGVAGPVALALLVVHGIFGRSLLTALATGAALAPTSLGFSATLLAEFEQLKTDVGQLICTTAVMDDTISLMLMAELSAITGVMTAWALIQPILASAGSLIIGAILAGWVFPKILPRVLALLPSKEDNPHVRQWCMITMLIIFPITVAYLCALAGTSDLLGIICGTLPFTLYPEVMEAWHGSYAVKAGVEWGTRLFFACTVGFAVPKVGVVVGDMLYLASFVMGCLYFVLAYVGKSFLAPFALPLTLPAMQKYALGMQGRGEFSFIILAQASTDGLLESDDLASVTWGLLLTCFITPAVFRMTLHFSPKENLGNDVCETDHLLTQKILKV